MKKFPIKVSAALLAVLHILLLCSCSSKKEEPTVTTLPPVVTVGIPEKEKVTTTLESEGFTVNVYESYSEIVDYDGEATELVIPDAFLGVSVKRIGKYAFFGNDKLVKVTLPKGLIEIDNNAFEACSALDEVIVGDRLEKINQSAFRDSSLSKIELPDTVCVIERYAFYRTKLTSFRIPDGVSAIGKYAFFGCAELKEVVFGARVTSLYEYAFHDCTALTEMILPETVSSIGDYCFRGCTSLSKIFVPKNTKIGENAFLSCPKLTIYTPKGSKAAAAAKKWSYNYEICPSPDQMQ